MRRKYQKIVFIMNPFIRKTALMPMSCATRWAVGNSCNPAHGGQNSLVWLQKQQFSPPVSAYDISPSLAWTWEIQANGQTSGSQASPYD